MKKSVVKNISLCALSLITGFFYSFVNVYAEEYTFIDPVYVSAYNAFINLGFKQPDITSETNINLVNNISGSVTGDDSFQLDLSNVRMNSYTTSDIYIGDMTVGSQSGTGYLSGSTTDGNATCKPKSTSQSSSQYTCTYSNTLTFDVIQVKGFENSTMNGSYSGTIDGSNIAFDISESGSITGTITQNIKYSSHYLINDPDHVRTLDIFSNREYISGYGYEPIVRHDLDTYIVAVVKGTFYGSSYSSNTHIGTLFKYYLGSSLTSMSFGSQAPNGNWTNEYISSVCWWYTTRTSSGYTRVIKNSDFEYPEDFEIIPLYVGSGKNMPSDIRDMIGLGSREILLQLLGTEKSKESVDSANSANTDLSSGFNQFNNIEDGFNNDLTSGFKAIDTSTNITTDSNFINSALWISQQFTRIVSYPAINLTLVFCLVLGLAMTLIGKLRG